MKYWTLFTILLSASVAAFPHDDSAYHQEVGFMKPTQHMQHKQIQHVQGYPKAAQFAQKKPHLQKQIQHMQHVQGSPKAAQFVPKSKQFITNNQMNKQHNKQFITNKQYAPHKQFITNKQYTKLPLTKQHLSK